MTQKKTGDFFDRKTAQGYDGRARKVGAINDAVHLLTGLVLSRLPADAKILCVGAGTGSEILPLAAKFPGWRFDALDPSGSMLEICKERAEEGGIAGRCRFVHGYLSDFESGAEYDAVLCLLVTHFLTDDAERQAMFDDMSARLKPGGYLINSDICYDTATPAYADILEAWKEMHILSGASGEQAAAIPQTLATHVGVRSPRQMEAFLRAGGFPLPVLFFQSLLIHAWYSQKP